MKRAAVLMLIVLGACLDGGGTSPPDSPDGPNGSGSSAAIAGYDPSPPDVTLQWLVVGLSTIVIAGSLRARRRDPNTPAL
ncbi:MAG TPA: hypothetical protein VFQ53_08055 [Kofleriaceae bacterium]|nr:hypothetical protein [Kofleriaceae bacterium]